MRLAGHDRSAQFNKHQISKPVMVSVVSSIPTGGNFIVAETF